jgi:hypothetical protein
LCRGLASKLHVVPYLLLLFLLLLMLHLLFVVLQEVVTGRPAGDTLEGEERWEEAQEGSLAPRHQDTPTATPAAVGSTSATPGTTMRGPVTTGTGFDAGMVSGAQGFRVLKTQFSIAWSAWKGTWTGPRNLVCRTSASSTR